MQIKNSTERFGLVAMALHWLMAIIIISILLLGLYMTSLADGDDKWALYGWHKSFGIIIFMLILGRLYWRIKNVVPPMPDGLNRIEQFLAHVTHYGIYVLLIALPIIGYIDSSAGDYHIGLFNWFDIPKVIAKDKALEELSVIMHWVSAYTLGVLILMHIGAAFKHHFILKDNVLLRMLPFKLRK